MATGLIVNVGADTTDFKTEIRELPKEFEKAEQEITQSADRVGGAIDGALKGLISAGTVVALERVINHFDKMADAASKYGETAEDIQRVGTAAELTGGNIDSIAMAMERAGVAAAKAARGNEEFVEKFNRAGIDAAAFSTATLTERVEMVARAQQEAGTSGDRHAAILEALGDSVAGIDFQRIADEMGNVVVASNETVEQLSRANDIMQQAKATAMVFAAEGLGTVASYFEKIGNILGEASSGGTLAKMYAFNKVMLQLSPFGGAADLLGLGGKTNKELENTERRLNAIALLRSRDGISNATEDQIKAEMDAIVERERAATNATNKTNAALEEGKAKAEQSAQLKQRLLEINLQLKEAEVAQNTELAKQLRYQEDLYKGLIKYKDAEDAYGMAVREANAELAKRNEKLKFADKGNGAFQESVKLSPEALAAVQPKLKELEAFYAAQEQRIRQSNSDISAQTQEMMRLDDLYRSTKLDTLRGGNALQTLQRGQEMMTAQAAMPEAERQRVEATARQENRSASASSLEDPATETTLQKVANFLEQLNTKLPQPVLA